MGGAAPAQPPVQMADGGYVQNFFDGSDEDGVTPYAYSPELTAAADQYMMDLMASAPRETPDLETAMQSRLPTYQRILGGGDKDLTQAQMLFALSQAAFNYAGNVDAQGRPLRGSGIARAAQAFAPVPGQIGALAAAQGKEDRAVKLAALQAAEKDIENIRKYNQELLSEKRKLMGDVAKASASSAGKGISGSSMRGRTRDYLIKYAPLWESGNMDPAQRLEYSQFYTDYTAPYLKKDPVSGSLIEVVPKISKELLESYNRGAARYGEEALVQVPAPAEQAPTEGKPASREEKYLTPEQIESLDGLELLDAAPDLWNMAKYARGPFPAVVGTAAEVVPGLGGSMPALSQAREILPKMTEDLIAVFLKNERAAVSEQDRLRKIYSVNPSLFGDENAYHDRLIAIARNMDADIRSAIKDGDNEDLPSETRQKARTAAAYFKKFREKLNLPKAAYTADDIGKIPCGNEYLWKGVVKARRNCAK